MIDFNEPVLADKRRADALFYETDYRANDFSFGNLFIWRKKSRIKIAFHEGFLLTRFEADGKTRYLFPAGAGDKASVIRQLAADAAKLGQPFTIACATPVMIAELERTFPGLFEIMPDRSNYDYVYNTSDLISLAGRKYHGKRNHIARFRALGDWSYEDITPQNLPECIRMNDEWCKLNGCGQDSGLGAEYCAVREALQYYGDLSFSGGLLRLGGRVIAFTIGERLCKDTFVVHIEKAFSEIEGAYPAINNEFVIHNCETYAYVNREEDTGDEGLRKAKLSYHPAILLEKDTAVLKAGVQL